MNNFSNNFKYSQVTKPKLYFNRRSFLAGGTALFLSSGNSFSSEINLKYKKDDNSKNLKLNSFRDITTYNNFYEFGTGKKDPSKYAKKLTTDPWGVEVSGFVNRPGNYSLEDILKKVNLEERIYSLRCVEGWSMIIPWIGFQLSDFLNIVEPTSKAKYVSFQTLYRPDEMFGQKYNILKWPYAEGLTIDEAMHPLTILSTGLYGKVLPNQNGAPIRLVVPWKYGFKSIKSIVKIKLTDKQPICSWNLQNPREYGFYSNVNPEVDHPRWSQATERPIGQGLFSMRKPTKLFNGYGEDVAYLYKGIDLRKNY